MDRILISGASGVLGSALIQELSGSLDDDVELVALVRRPRSPEAFRTLFGPSWRSWRVLVCDLTDRADVEAAIAALPAVESGVGVHLAADVSWNKELAAVAPLNVEGSLNFGRILRATSRSPRLIYGSTAYTSPGHPVFRNSYEESKALGEAKVRDASEMPVSTFSCSLIVGHSRTGAISRFHGFYPLLRYASTYPVPFWVCDEGAQLDLVPLDWTARQLRGQVRRIRGGGPCDDVVASAGEARVRASEAIVEMYAALNAYREGRGRGPVEPPPLISSRRWDFLRRSMKAWGKGPADVPALKYFERLMEVYRCYLCNGPGMAVLPPRNVDGPAPDPRDYLRTVFDYWYEATRPPLKGTREERSWHPVSR